MRIRFTEGDGPGNTGNEGVPCRMASQRMSHMPSPAESAPGAEGATSNLS